MEESKSKRKTTTSSAVKRRWNKENNIRIDVSINKELATRIEHYKEQHPKVCQS